MMVLKIVTIFACLCTVYTISVPSWEVLQVMLHEKLEDIYQNDKAEVHKKIQRGKYFKYYLPTEPGTYKAVQDGTDQLPHWLTFDEKKKKLQGIPLEADVQQGLKIVFTRTDKKSDKNTRTLILDVLPNPEPFRCKETTTVASMIFHADLKSLSPHNLLKFMRHFTGQFEMISIHDLHIEHGNKMDGSGLLNSQIRMAGPGDRLIKGDQPGFTLSWKLKCGVDISGHSDIAKLRSYSQNEDFESKFSKPVLGWFVTSRRSSRNRRAIGLSGTPGVTPTVSVQGTPTLGPSSTTVDIRSTSQIIAIVPSSTVPPMEKTSTVPPMTPTPGIITTERPTTPPTTTETTTEKPITTPYVNKPPVVDEQFAIGPLTVPENTALVSNVHSGLFTDVEELAIKLLYKNKTYTPDIPSWIKYVDIDKEGKPARRLYIFPGEDAVGRNHNFALKATDTYGLFANHFFSITVRKDRSSYKVSFNVTINLEYDKIANIVEEKIKLLRHLSYALYDDEEKYNVLKNIEFSPGSVIVKWSVKELSNISCNSPDVVEYERKLTNSGFADAMAPDYIVLDTGAVAPPECPLESIPVPEKSDNLLERILIPVIIIVIILLIIALILCCVYRRKRTYETAQEQNDETYLNHKKPVIFLEEFEDKPDFVSLQPLILPNEKPPVPDQAYGPRGGSPDGPESSTTVSTESDENAPLAPKSPKDRTGYNAPPPYSAR